MTPPRLALPRIVIGALAATALLAADAAGQAEAERKPATPAAATQAEETPEILPDGQGRHEAFYRCTACHGTAVIRRSALSRGQWDELMDWMAEKHAMPALEGAERDLIVGYLASAFPLRRRGGPRSPFSGEE